MLLLFRMGTHVTIPGINSLVVSGISSDSTDGLLGMVDLFAGGALLKFSIFALGIMPYISSSIIMQLVMVLIPNCKNCKKKAKKAVKNKPIHKIWNNHPLHRSKFSCNLYGKNWSTGTGVNPARYPGTY